MLYNDILESFLLLVNRFSCSVSLNSWGRVSVLSVLVGSHLDDSGVNAAGDAVLHFDIEFGDDVGFEGLGFLEIFFGGGVDDISDGKPFDGFVLGAESSAVDADDGFDVSSVIFVPAVVSSLDGHVVVNDIRKYIY